MRWQDHIEFNRDAMGGKPVIKGTRMSVEFILEALRSVATIADLLESYPHLREEYIRAALKYANSV